MRQCGKRGTAGDRSRGCWEQMVGLLRFRFAAGVCVLAAGLLMGAGGAVAVADPSGSAAHGDDASGDQHSTGAKKPKDEPGATTSKTGANAPGQQPKKPKDKPGATTSTTGGASTSTTSSATTTATAAATTTSTRGTTTPTTGATTSTTGSATTSTSGASTSTTGASTSSTGAATD